MSNLIAEIITKSVLSTSSPIIAIEPTAYKFKEIISIIQKKQNRFRPLFPVPWQLPWVLIKAINYLGIKTTYRSDGMIGYVYYNEKLDITSLAPYKTRFRKFK